MNILIVTQHYFPEPFRVSEIARELAKEGYRVTVLTGLPNYTTGKIPKEYRWFRKRREKLDGAEVIRCPLIARRTGVFWRALNYGSFWASSLWHTSTCRRKDYDLIFCYQTSPVTMAAPAVRMKKRAGAPLLLYCLDLWPESLKTWGVKETSFLYKRMLSYSRRIYKACDRIAVTSQPFRQYFTQVIGVGEEKLFYLPQHAAPMELPEKPLPRPGGALRLAFGGNIGSAQDIPCIIKAAARLKDLPQIRFDLYGDGSELSACQKLARELGVTETVRFHGRVTPEELQKAYTEVDAFLLTLNGKGAVAGTMPAKLQEYMSAGKPVIAAIGGAAAQVIREAGCGAVAAPSDDAGLARQIRRLAEAPQEFSQCGQNARAYFENNFTKKIYLERLNGLFRQMAETPTPRTGKEPAHV